MASKFLKLADKDIYVTRIRVECGQTTRSKPQWLRKGFGTRVGPPLLHSAVVPARYRASGKDPEASTGCKNCRRSNGTGHMARCGKSTFGDSDGYAAAFGDANINLTITGVGDFKAELTWLKLDNLDVYRYRCSQRGIGIAKSCRASPIFRCPPPRSSSPFPSAGQLSQQADLPFEPATLSCTVVASECISDRAAGANGV